MATACPGRVRIDQTSDSVVSTTILPLLRGAFLGPLSGWSKKLSVLVAAFSTGRKDQSRGKMMLGPRRLFKIAAMRAGSH